MAPYNPPIAHYCHINVSNYSDNAILMAMGKKGNVFKEITKNSKVDYIWWNQEMKIIEIWGPFEYMYEGRFHLCTYLSHFQFL